MYYLRVFLNFYEIFRINNIFVKIYFQRNHFLNYRNYIIQTTDEIQVVDDPLLAENPELW